MVGRYSGDGREMAGPRESKESEVLMNLEHEARQRGERGQRNGANARPAARAGGAAASSRPELASLPLEAALEELDRIVANLEDGQLALDDSLALYERGMRLTQRCQELLDTAELRVQRLRPASSADVGAAGGYALDEFEADEE